MDVRKTNGVFDSDLIEDIERRMPKLFFRRKKKEKVNLIGTIKISYV